VHHIFASRLLLCSILLAGCTVNAPATERSGVGDAEAQQGSADASATIDASYADGGSTPRTCRGYTTRYWDCCKAHCAWSANVDEGLSPVTSCNASNTPMPDMPDAPSACDTGASTASAHTCYSMRPWAVSETLAYGFAAVPARGAICGRCYMLEFDGTGHYDAADPGSQTLVAKRMIVQATNIGHDVDGGQFDILIPGGGVGLFDACSAQWGVAESDELGAQYGGILTACRETFGDHSAYSACVRERCQSLFRSPGLTELRAGCEWFVDWYGAADNPNVDYFEVACPDAIIAVSGVDRRPFDDIRSCPGE